MYIRLNNKNQKLLVKTLEIEEDPIAKQPLEMGIEALIAIIDDKEELRKALIEYTKRKYQRIPQLLSSV